MKYHPFFLNVCFLLGIMLQLRLDQVDSGYCLREEAGRQWLESYLKASAQLWTSNWTSQVEFSGNRYWDIEVIRSVLGTPLVGKSGDERLARGSCEIVMQVTKRGFLGGLWEYAATMLLKTKAILYTSPW